MRARLIAARSRGGVERLLLRARQLHRVRERDPQEPARAHDRVGVAQRRLGRQDRRRDRLGRALERVLDAREVARPANAQPRQQHRGVVGRELADVREHTRARCRDRRRVACERRAGRTALARRLDVIARDVHLEAQGHVLRHDIVAGHGALHHDPLGWRDLLRDLEHDAVAVRQERAFVAVVAHGHAVLVRGERVACDQVRVGDVAVARSLQRGKHRLRGALQCRVPAHDVGGDALVGDLALDAQAGHARLYRTPRLDVQAVVLAARVCEKVGDSLLDELLVRVRRHLAGRRQRHGRLRACRPLR
eukprot:Unigene9235_Nuclearia_a/m.28200 Unigene9235_Nuclearia_a/g.28200  ORF Unigene9235_Nuclearia_a/g.28200 Unigene9235_Nuclearia_a/m.28200 type:complete len:306 (+) Unigene9235_Nuclearia_a:1238-2155(+)